MIDHAIKLSSTKLAFMLHKSLFQTLKYPERGIGSMYMLSQKYTQMVIIYELKVATTQKIRYLEYHFLTNIVITIIITIIIIIIIIIKIIIIIIKNCDLVWTILQLPFPLASEHGCLLFRLTLLWASRYFDHSFYRRYVPMHFP